MGQLISSPLEQHQQPQQTTLSPHETDGGRMAAIYSTQLEAPPLSSVIGNAPIASVNPGSPPRRAPAPSAASAGGGSGGGGVQQVVPAVGQQNNSGGAG
ncbi:hypothetical protein BIW11_03818, partial [Tropilaelaps mercedesae]